MKKYIRTLLLGLCCPLWLLCSCVEEDNYKNTPSDNLEALWKMMDEHYCFFDYKKAEIGLDWDSVHSVYAEKIHPKMGSEQLFEVLSEMLAELKDGHVNLYTAWDVGRNWSWKEDYPTNFSYDIQDAYLGNDYRIAASLKYRILDDNIGYIVCSSFSSGLGNGNITEVLSWLQVCDGLIIDVRNNGGGMLSNAEILAQRFTNERLHVGYLSHKTGTGHQDFSAPVAEYLDPSSSLRWQKPVVVLTNRGCYSATNTFVRDMKCCPAVLVLGDKTGGGSGLPFSSELPNGWSVRFSACPMYDNDMQQIEFGIEPDTVVSLTDADRLRFKDTLIETARQILKHQ